MAGRSGWSSVAHSVDYWVPLMVARLAVSRERKRAGQMVAYWAIVMAWSWAVSKVE